MVDTSLTARWATRVADICGLARTLLSQRLKRLIALGVFETIPVSQTGHYHEYVLTDMGRELFPVVTALRQWGADYFFDDSEPRPCLVDRRTEIPVAPVGVQSADDEPLAPEDTQTVVRGPDGVGDYAAVCSAAV